jgi:2-oxoisovalerate dehydrogenase E1 component
MTKDIHLNPDQLLQPGALRSPDIPLMSFSGGVSEARSALGEDNLLAIGRDMVLIREFETMLDSIKKQGSYRGIDYVHQGPAHLSIGQEAAAVGQAFTLDVTDRVFGSHRSHGEVIAKGLSAIRRGNIDDILRSCETWAGGEAWRVVADKLPADSAHEQALHYLLYGMTAETFGRRTGFNRGLGGSMHAFFPPLGIYPNNAIVGGSAPLATGAALYNRLRQKPGIVVASIGDASLGCGPVWESFNFAAMAQWNQLMADGYRGGLPVVFFIVNNFYGMGGQTLGETMGFDRLARIGLGVNPQAMHAETIDGNNPLAVIDAMDRARQHIDEGTGPVLLDVQTYRFSGHSPSDASSYRTADEVSAWEAVDPLTVFYRDLVTNGLVTDDQLSRDQQWAAETLSSVLVHAIDLTTSPRLSLRDNSTVMAEMTLPTPQRHESSSDTPELLISPDEVPHLQALAKKSRRGVDDTGKTLSGQKAITYRDALLEAIVHHVTTRADLALWGEENRDWGGSFGVYRGLTELLPRHRLFNSPISEAAIVGAGVGYALAGGRSLVELMYADFIGRAGDEIFNQMAKWQAMSGGTVDMPMVLRVSVGAKYGAQHSQDWSSMLAGIPGLSVVVPATPYDAKGLLSEALAGSTPVAFFESQRLYDQVETLHPDGVPAGDYRIPLGQSRIVRPGEDLTVLSVGAVLGRALDAASVLDETYGLSAEVIDARSMVPFDYSLLFESVQKTGRLVLVADAVLRGSWLNQVAATVTRELFDSLDGPAVVLGAQNWISPPAEMEWEYFVTPADIVDAVHRFIRPLAGHQLQPGHGGIQGIDDARRGL